MLFRSVGIPIYSPTYQNYFNDNFDGTNTGWTTGSGISNNSANKWEWGLPNYGATNSTFSGPKCWDVNLNSTYYTPGEVYLFSPYFDFTQAGINNNPTISFWLNYNTSFNLDGVILQYALNNGNWNTLGNLNNPLCATNWYNSLLDGTYG